MPAHRELAANRTWHHEGLQLQVHCLVHACLLALAALQVEVRY